MVGIHVVIEFERRGIRHSGDNMAGAGPGDSVCNLTCRARQILKVKMMSSDEQLGSGGSNVVSRFFKSIGVRYQTLLDKWTPHTKSRWIFAIFLIVVFLARVILAQGWYIVTYALGIYHLNLFIAFLTPKIDPALDFEDDGPELPTTSSKSEFRPFIRRLPEFKFWLGIVKSTLIGITCTLFDCFNVPVFWPILVMYFITLFCITMKRQIKHMIKYKYIPFTHGKPKYVVQNPPT